MDVTVSVGEVTVKVRGVDWSNRAVLSLLRQVAGVAVLVSGEVESEPEKAPMGFAAHLERAPEVVEDLSEWFEEAP